MTTCRVCSSVIVLGAFLASSQVSLAGSLQVAAPRISAVPVGGNARITATVPPGSTVSSARVYFNAADEKVEYYLEMVRGDGGSFWAVLPIPKSATKEVQYRVVLRDAEGKETAAARERVPVSSANEPPLTEAEQRYAKNLVIGITDPSVPLLPTGFECYGVVSAINVRGELIPNEVCRKTIIPPALWVGAGTAAAVAGAVIIRNGGEKLPVSPSRPSPPPRNP